MILSWYCFGNIASSILFTGSVNVLGWFSYNAKIYFQNNSLNNKMNLSNLIFFHENERFDRFVLDITKKRNYKRNQFLTWKYGVPKSKILEWLNWKTTTNELILEYLQDLMVKAFDISNSRLFNLMEFTVWNI